MVYLLGDQALYFPSSDDQSYPLRTFLKGRFRSESSLPMIVRLKSSNIFNSAIKQVLNKNTPLLLLDVDQFQCLLAEFHSNGDRRFSSNRSRFFLSQGKMRKKILNKKKSKKSLVSFTDNFQCNEQNEDDFDPTRTVVRSLNESVGSSSVLCRVPIDYDGLFEILNENDQSVEPFHRLSQMFGTNFQTERNFQSFLLRSPCLAFTKRSTSNGRTNSASVDSCYGSFSDLESQKTVFLLNEQSEIVPAGRTMTILSVCSALRVENSTRNDESRNFQVNGAAWFREKSRRFFSRRKAEEERRNETLTGKTRENFRVEPSPEIFVKSRSDDGEIFFFPIDSTGDFSPILSGNVSATDEQNTMDFSSLFQLKQMLKHFRFPISVRLVEKSVSFVDNFQPSVERDESSTKLRLLLPFAEEIVFVCPLINNSSNKMQPLVIPIPIDTDIEVQRCLNMREVTENPLFHQLIRNCLPIIQRYQTQFSLIHFPVVLNSSSLLGSKRKTTLFKKRSTSESNLETIFPENCSNFVRRSQQFLSGSTPFDLNETLSRSNIFDENQFADSFRRNKIKFQQSTELNQRRSASYSKLKFDRTRKSSQILDSNSDDENYRDLDQIYDFIRSGDFNDEVRRIQEKEAAFNRAGRQKINEENQQNVNISFSSIKNKQKANFTPNNRRKSAASLRFAFHLDDSRPIDSETDDERVSAVPNFRNEDFSEV